MKTTLDFIEDLKAAYNLASDYAAAKKLGITRGALSKYRCRGTTFDDKTAVDVAELLDLNPMYVVASANAERAMRQGDETLVNFWTQYAEQAVNNVDNLTH